MRYGIYQFTNQTRIKGTPAAKREEGWLIHHKTMRGCCQFNWIETDKFLEEGLSCKWLTTAKNFRKHCMRGNLLRYFGQITIPSSMIGIPQLRDSQTTNQESSVHIINHSRQWEQLAEQEIKRVLPVEYFYYFC